MSEVISRLTDPNDPRLSTLLIKNMVCARCIRVVREELTEAGIVVHDVKLGEALVDTETLPSAYQLQQLLHDNGFELLADREEQMVERIKQVVISFVHQDNDSEPTMRNSDYIAQQLMMSYSSISKLFSRHEGITLEKYIIYQKLERVKELLQYNQMTLSEIAFQMGYRSVQHLSNQFKKYLDMSVTAYKNQYLPRKPLDDV